MHVYVNKGCDGVEPVFLPLQVKPRLVRLHTHTSCSVR